MAAASASLEANAASASRAPSLALPPSNGIAPPASSSAAHPLARKVRDILLTPPPADLAPIRAALDDIAALYPLPAAARHADPAAAPASERRRARTPATQRPAAVDIERARRDLARDSERQAARAARDFAGVLGNVHEALTLLTDHVEEMSQAADEVQARLHAAASASAYLREHAVGLQRQRTTTASQSTLLSLFLARFTLTEEENEAVTSRAVPVGPELFAALDRLAQIRTDCAVLLVGREEGEQGGMRAGMDIMDATAAQLDAGQTKMARWLTFEFRQPFKEGAEVGFTMREAVRRLETRPDLLRPALQILAAARASNLSNAFHVALTQGGPAPSFLPRPIEVHAHDPQRYVGDMLAWVHQSVASEREFLVGLFGREAEDEPGERGGRRVGERRRGIESVDWTKGRGEEERRVREVLDRVMEGCGRPLKIRIEQTVNSQEGCITTFHLASLVHFYRVTMDHTIGSKASLSCILAEISQTSYVAFLRTLDRLAAGLERISEPPSAELDAPPPLLGACGTLKELLAVHQSSLSEQDLFPGHEASATSGPNLANVLGRIVDPLLALCRRMAEAHIKKRGAKAKEAGTWEASIFLTNCLSHLKSVLSPYAFAEPTVKNVEKDIAEQIVQMTEGQYVHLLGESGLASILDAMENRPPGIALAQQAGATPVALAKQLDKLEAFLGSPQLISPARLALLSAPSLRAVVHAGSLRRLARAYARIEDEIRLPTSAYPPGVMKRSAGEIRLLLGFGDEKEDAPEETSIAEAVAEAEPPVDER